ncbi:MAG: type IV pilus biogenesis/stability protein PilW [Burkholderiales bacterium]|nr:type IV pilus biogenesis/stability protein PilW [Burkholderiales bacterium]
MALTPKHSASLRAWCGAAALVVATTVLPGCVAPAAAPTQDLRTESDQTDADRRARVRMELASAYFGRGQNSTALDEVKLALQAKPDLTEAHNLRGLIYARMGEHALAEESFRRALQLSPRDADTMHNYGWYLCQQRRFPEAEAQFNAALAVPNYRDLTRTLLAMGVCQARNNQWAEAERSLQRSYELDPANPATAVNLAEVLLRRGEPERARFYIRRVNNNDQYISAQTLWLAARIEHKLGETAQVRALGNQLLNRFPQSPEATLYEKGQFE